MHLVDAIEALRNKKRIVNCSLIGSYVRVGPDHNICAYLEMDDKENILYVYEDNGNTRKSCRITIFTKQEVFNKNWIVFGE